MSQCFYFLTILAFVLNLSHSSAQMVPGVFIFGDSLVDVGNNNHLDLSLAKADFPHNGMDFPTKRATGRFSNGKNAADFIAEKLGLPASPPYLSLLSLSNKTNAFNMGVSFASGGAGILNDTNKLFKQSIALTKQVDYCTMVKEELVQQVGAIGTQQILSKSLFIMVIGSNDIFRYFKKDSAVYLKYSPQQYIDLLAVTMKSQIKRLYDLGARKFVVIGTSTIGCCPSQRIQNTTGNGECNEVTNYWSRKYNVAANLQLMKMKAELKEINYSFFDTYSVFRNFIQKPSLYGFTEVKAACCGLGNLNAVVPCLPIATYCANRTNHVFWDLFHPTEAASKLIVDTFFAGSQQYVYPITVKQLVSM